MPLIVLYMQKKKKTKAVDIKKQKILTLYSGFHPSPSTAAADSRGERQGHCMKHQAFMSTLVKWLLSSADG